MLLVVFKEILFIFPNDSSQRRKSAGLNEAPFGPHAPFLPPNPQESGGWIPGSLGIGKGAPCPKQCKRASFTPIFGADIKNLKKK